jgi:LysM repeat protein
MLGVLALSEGIEMQLRRSIMIHSFLAVALCLIVNVSNTLAQEDDDIYLFYYEDERPNQLDVVLLQNNICLEAVLKLNPDLDINNVVYGDAFYVPVGEPCYQYDTSIYGYWNFYDGYPPRLKYYENGKRLSQPYYSDRVIYVNPNSVEALAHQYNICRDVLLAENILLQHFDEYKKYAFRSIDVFLPQNAPPCEPDWRPQKALGSGTTLELPVNTVTPQYFVKQYNVCPEEIPELLWANYFYDTLLHASTAILTIPDNAKPCYNEHGRRLRYYDDLGKPLETPEYSELPIYIANPGETMQSISQLMGVCLIDLLRVNHFPDLPALVPVELFMPPSRPCSDEAIKTHVIENPNSRIDLESLSYEFNICVDLLRNLNPHLSQPAENAYVQSPLYENGFGQHWILLPQTAPPCYRNMNREEGKTDFDLEHELNVCHEKFRWIWFLGSRAPHLGNQMTLFIPLDAPACYDDRGYRLQYPPGYQNTNNLYKVRPSTLKYAEMPIHIFQQADTVYTVSRQYNVCVRDLLAANPRLAEAMPTGYPTFIPKTRPCYDEASGMPLIYEDMDGKPLPEPQVGKDLMYYGGQPIGRVSYYYNVCENRIEDANREKLERRSSYLGWIIPTDRPPCYDQDGNPIDYVCYRQPVDFTVDYAGSNLTFNVDGTYCYDLAKQDTEVWYQGKPYKMIAYYESTLLDSRAFTAWCYGVSLDEINTINDNPDILALLPFQHRAIPQPTRDCYVDNPQILSGKHRYLVEAGDTLSSIANRFSKPAAWIADVNDLDKSCTIWAGQILIIPSGTTLTDLYLLITGSGASVVILGAVVYYWLRRRSKSLKHKVSAA